MAQEIFIMPMRIIPERLELVVRRRAFRNDAALSDLSIGLL
jgi:hypothetical protein